MPTGVYGPATEEEQSSVYDRLLGISRQQILDAIGRQVLFEVPTGDVDGINDEFTFTAPPIFVTYQGIIQDITTDYTLVGSTVTFVVPPVSGSVRGLVSA
jgi:hypothetical protein